MASSLDVTTTDPNNYHQNNGGNKPLFEIPVSLDGNHSNTINHNERHWRNFMIERQNEEQMFNIEFDHKLTSNNFAADSNLFNPS